MRYSVDRVLTVVYALRSGWTTWFGQQHPYSTDRSWICRICGIRGIGDPDAAKMKHAVQHRADFAPIWDALVAAIMANSNDTILAILEAHDGKQS